MADGSYYQALAAAEEPGAATAAAATASDDAAAAAAAPLDDVGAGPLGDGVNAGEAGPRDRTGGAGNLVGRGAVAVDPTTGAVDAALRVTPPPSWAKLMGVAPSAAAALPLDDPTTAAAVESGFLAGAIPHRQRDANMANAPAHGRCCGRAGSRSASVVQQHAQRELATPAWVLEAAFWVILAVLAVVSGAMVGATKKGSTSHTMVRSILYFTALCIGSSLFGAVVDWLLFLLLESMAALSQPFAVVFYYASSFKGTLGGVLWVVMALATYDSILVNVDMTTTLRLLLLIGAVIIARGARNLALKVFVTATLGRSLALTVQQALEAKFIARQLSAPDAWQQVSVAAGG